MNRNLKQKHYLMFLTLPVIASKDKATKNPAWINQDGVKKSIYQLFYLN